MIVKEVFAKHHPICRKIILSKEKTDIATDIACRSEKAFASFKRGDRKAGTVFFIWRPMNQKI